MVRLRSKLSRAYRFALRRTLHKELHSRPPQERQEQFRYFLGKIQRKENPLVCVIGGDNQELSGKDVKFRYASFDVASDENILDVVRQEQIDAFYLNRCLPRDLVNLVNFLGVYAPDIPVLMGSHFRCHSLIGYAPVMPGETISTSVSIYNYFAKNYRISDTLLYQGYVYQGKKLVDCHQFLMKPDEVRLIELPRELNMEGIGPAMYYLEVFHPQLPTSTPECRYYGLYSDKSSGFMAGIHSLPLRSWYDFGIEGRTLVRTFFPNLDGLSVRYVIPGCSAHTEGSKIKAQTSLGNELLFTPSGGQGAIEAVIQSPKAPKTPPELEFDRVAPGVPILGGQGFQTLWMEGKSLAVWHDGSSHRELRKRIKGPTVRDKAAGMSADKNRKISGVLAEEQKDSRVVSKNLIDLYQKRVKFFTAVFPFLGHSYPDLHIVFDCEQWASDILNFEIALYTNSGIPIEAKPFHFNRSLQTVNLNRLFADQLAEITQGCWMITADPRAQGDRQELGDLQYPSDAMLFAFWSDGTKIYDSVHSLEPSNLVAFDFGLGQQRGSSEMARATSRIISRTRKFAPFMASGELASLYWLCNAGISEEKVDAHVKLRLYGPGGLEEITSFILPSNCARIVSANEILRECNVSCPQGTLWIESNDCNVGALWFLHAGDGKGFAVDHFTGG